MFDLRGGREDRRPLSSLQDGFLRACRVSPMGSKQAYSRGPVVVGKKLRDLSSPGRIKSSQSFDFGMECRSEGCLHAHHFLCLAP